MGYFLMPIAKVGEEWSVSDDVLRMVWRKAMQTGAAVKTFYDVAWFDEEDFIEFLHSPYRFPVLVVNESPHPSVVAIAWMTPYGNNNIQIHYCPLTIAGYKTEIGRMIFDYWKRFRSPDGESLVSGVIAITPVQYESMNRYAVKLGLKHIGKLEQYMPMACEGKRTDVNLYYGIAGRDL